ncbi:MAG: hypothetical protein DMG00_27660 [Acidobacteria bacterium]|nr:MAG: hypothetical protein DMG00_27660 [Acidobacteriota bacterium]
MTAHAKSPQRMLMGPWGHAVNTVQQLGEVDFGPDALIDLDGYRADWLDGVLGRGSPPEQPPVRMFVMGANVWRDEQEWPLTRARATRLYLHSSGTANTRMGDGTLSDKTPGAERSDVYAYDPRYPVPTYGGHGSGGGGITRDGAFSIQGPMDQRSTQQRADVLVYTTENLPADTEVTGAAELSLFFSTDVIDTDFFATLSDVYPDGRAILITEGALRTRHRESREMTKLLTPKQTYEVKIPLWETSNVFKAGHRIRLHITSSNFPRFNRNLNSGKPMAEEMEEDIQVAHQVILHDAQHPSSLMLPVVPADAKRGTPQR